MSSRFVRLALEGSVCLSPSQVDDAWLGTLEARTLQLYLDLDCASICESAKLRVHEERKGICAEGEPGPISLQRCDSGDPEVRLGVFLTELLRALEDPEVALSPGSVFQTAYLQEELLCAVMVAMARCPADFSPDQVCAAVLPSPLCPILVPRMVENDPLAFRGVLPILVAAVSGSKRASDIRYAETTLLKLAAGSKRRSVAVRHALLKERALPGLVATLTIDPIGDAVAFLGSEASRGRSWFWKHLAAACRGRETVGAAEDGAPEHQLVQSVTAACQGAGVATVTAGMRVVCALGGLGSISLTPLEAEQCAVAVEGAVRGSRLGELAVGWLLSSPGIGTSLGKERIEGVWGSLLEKGAPEVRPRYGLLSSILIVPCSLYASGSASGKHPAAYGAV